MSKTNPLNYEDRRHMLLQAFPNADWLIIDKVADHPDDSYWSRTVDNLIEGYIKDRESRLYAAWPEQVCLYGSRGSFLPYYSGKFKTEELTAQDVIFSGTQHRADICANPPHTADYRRGKIAASADRHPVNYVTVDGIICNGNSFLLGRKKGNEKFQFIGGFTDPTDATLEAAVRREAGEEVENWNGFNSRYDDRETYKAPSIKIDKLKMLGSLRVDDSRYRNEVDKIMTVVFLCHTPDYDNLAGADDIETVKWFTIFELIANRELLAPVHQPLFDLLLSKVIKPFSEV